MAWEGNKKYVITIYRNYFIPNLGEYFLEICKSKIVKVDRAQRFNKKIIYSQQYDKMVRIGFGFHKYLLGYSYFNYSNNFRDIYMGCKLR